MDIVFAHELSEEALAKLQEIKQDLKSAGVGERVLNNLEYDVISDLAELREELHDSYDRAISNNPAEDIEEWKDIVSLTLPAGASAGMDNDVAAALEHIKSVY